MSEISMKEAAAAVIHIYEMFQVGTDGVTDAEFRYNCADEVASLGQWAWPLADEMRRQIDKINEDTTNG